MRPSIENILGSYSASEARTTAVYHDRHGVRHQVYADAKDGLTVQPPQASWMDAQFKEFQQGKGEVVINPTARHGKTVETNALKYFGLRFLARVQERGGRQAEAARLNGVADGVRQSFRARFINPAYATNSNETPLFDVVDDLDGVGPGLRPNMLWAVRGDLIPAETKAAVVAVATRDLWTPYGPRTLSPRDSRYGSDYRERQDRASQSGDNREKDRIYHQGPVWPWLIGAYIDAVRETWTGDRESLKARVRELLTPLMEYWMTDPAPGIPEIFNPGHKQEVLDETDNFRPNPTYVQRWGGTPKQAWSEAELIRSLVETGLFTEKELREWSLSVAKPYRILTENYTDDVAQAPAGTPFKVRAKVYIREGISSERLTVQVWTHNGTLPSFGQSWEGHFVEMHPVGKTEDGLAYIYETQLNLAEGKHEYKVRATAGLKNPDWYWDFTWADGGNVKVEVGARSELRKTADTVLDALSTGKALDLKAAAEVVRIENSPLAGDFEAEIREQARSEMRYAENYTAALVKSAPTKIEGFLAAHPDFKNDLTGFFKAKVGEVSLHASRALNADPDKKLRFAFAIPLPDTEEARTRILDYVRMVRELQKQHPSRVSGEIQVLATEAQIKDAGLKEFYAELGRTGLAKVYDARAQGTAYRFQDFMARNANALAYGLDSMELPEEQQLRMVRASEDVTSDTLLSVGMLLSYEFSGVQVVGEETLRQVPDFLPGTRFTATGLEIIHSAMDLVYRDYQVGALLASMA